MVSLFPTRCGSLFHPPAHKDPQRVVQRKEADATPCVRRRDSNGRDGASCRRAGCFTPPPNLRSSLRFDFPDLASARDSLAEGELSSSGTGGQAIAIAIAIAARASLIADRKSLIANRGSRIADRRSPLARRARQ